MALIPDGKKVGKIKVGSETYTCVAQRIRIRKGSSKRRIGVFCAVDPAINKGKAPKKPRKAAK